jgi:hypothetical protein
MTTFYVIKFKDGKYSAGDGKVSDELGGAQFYKTITGAMNSVSWYQATELKPKVVEVDIREREKSQVVPLHVVEKVDDSV